MSDPKPLPATRPSSFTNRFSFLAIIILVSLACSLPGLFSRSTPTPEAPPTATFTPVPPTPTPQPLPPAIVESNPPLGGEVPLTGPITLYFNQPMDRGSVESALSVQPDLPGELNWQDDTTLVFAPAQLLQPASLITFNLQTGARSARGLSLTEPVSLNFQTVGYLNLTQSLPEPDAAEIDPSSAVVAAFNHPVVALGADPASLPAAFSLQPEATGRAEWLNTSTYIFYPEPPLEGGKSYSVQLNPDLKGVDGSPLEASPGWGFTTASPRLVSLLPDPTAGEIRLDTVITLTFNQPMDTASAEANFALLKDGASPVPGKAVWNEDLSVLTFTPDNLLNRASTYQVSLGGATRARGGTPLGVDFQAGLQTVSPLAVVRSDPPQGGTLGRFGSLLLYLNGPIVEDHLLDQIVVTPPVSNLGAGWIGFESYINVYGDFAPDTEYSLTLLPGLSDPWGGQLQQGYTLNFRSGPLPPEVILSYGNNVLFLTPEDSSLIAQVTNYPQVSLSSGSLSLSDFIALVSGPNSYEVGQSYHARDERTWVQNLELATNISQPKDLNISPSGDPHPPGLYYLRINDTSGNIYPGPFLTVVGNAQLTFKLGASQALVWAVDLDTQAPFAGATVTILNERGEAVAQGQTDDQGVFQSKIPVMKDPYFTYYAILGSPGEESFGMALSTWNQGLSSWDFGLPTDYTGPSLKAYLYTDRPIYRPGQTVYFKAIVRQAYNGRYDLPDLGSLPLTLYRNYSDELIAFDLPLNAFGTAHGEYSLPPDAPPGDYRLASSANEYGISVMFQVAEYRKPEINLQVSFAEEQIQSGGDLQASIEARYFFDAPAGNLPVHWALYATPSFFYLPDHEVGVQDPRWLDAYYAPEFFDPLGALVGQGDGSTDPQGRLNLQLPTEAGELRMKYTLEVTAQDESGQPVSARASAEANPGQFYIGLRPDTWVGRADEPQGYSVQVVDWEAKPAGVHALRAEYQKVVWVEEDRPPQERYLGPKYVPQYTPLGSTDFQTSPEGQARLSFAPPEPGNYMLTVFGEGARSEIYLWIGGKGSAVWPNLPNQRLQLTTDQSAYQPGQTAQVFVPNPMPGSALALMTVERGQVLRHQVTRLDPGGSTLSIPLSGEDAPNVFVAVTLLGTNAEGGPDFRQGYLNLIVAPTEQTLNVSLTSQPQRLGPGEEVTFEIQVTDIAGQPVQGEFSLSVVDMAVLALADPNVTDIVSYFYGEQPLGVRTGVTLAAYARRQTLAPAGGMGGGGGDMIPSVVREQFPDTAYWNAEIVTGADGKATVSLPLPDSLTTWQVLVRGVSDLTRVGQAEGQVVVTKDLLLRPVTPRFLVVGDHAQLAAVVQNNTTRDLQVRVILQGSGFTLDDPGAASQTVSVSSNGRVRVEWWGTVQDIAEADLVFAAQAETGGETYEDATRPAGGNLPVLRYNAPQTFSTAGTVDEGGERLELVSLPRSFDPQGGKLQVELSSSLGGAMLSSLDALEHTRYESTELTLSRFLPNLEASNALKSLNIQAPDLQSRLERTLVDGIARLLARQNPDGGWGWYTKDDSDAFITAYVVYGLSRARQSGARVSETAIQKGIDFLVAGLYSPEMAAEAWELDRLAFVHFALASTGAGDLAGAQALYQRRDQLSPWAQAVLALTLQGLDPGSEAVTTLVSDLNSTAIRSATGAHWEQAEPTPQNMSSPLLNTATVVFTLAQLQPDSPILPDAVRYLMAHRRTKGWSSSYTTAWSLMALSEVMRTSGELGSSYTFSARLNGVPIANGQASGEGAPVVANIPTADLYAGDPNALSILRSAGSGRLYYTADLNVYRPVEDVLPLQRGVTVQRAYFPTGEACPGGDCAPITQAHAGDLVKARLTITLEDSAYYLLVEDFLPAGTEVLDTSLKTSQLGLPDDEGRVGPFFDPRRPYEGGWGWWYFTAPRIYDDRVNWASKYLPPGTYQLTYLLVVLQPGEYRVLPAHAWMYYFPETQGTSAGEIFSVQP